VLAFGALSPRIDPSAWIAPGAIVVGDVEIGPDSSVFFGCVLRGDVHAIRIGARTNVQDGTVVHVMHRTYPTRIGDDVTIGHGAIVHGCTIGNRVLIGMGAILLNGVEIGEGSIVAAGTLVPERTVVPPRSLVMGSPARVRRTLTDEEVASIQEYADNYVRYRLDYLEPTP